MRVLHVPAAVGGNPQGISRAERELGAESTSVVLAASPFGYEPDEVLWTEGLGRLGFESRRWRLLVRALRRYDVVHFNFGRTILPPQLRELDLPLLRAAGVVIAVTFQGDDARRGEPAGPSDVVSLPQIAPDLYPPRANLERRRRVARFAKWADLIYFLNPDLARFLPKRARFLPYSHVDPRLWRASPPSGDGIPVVVHAPSDRRIKGTPLLEEAVDQLKGEGVDIVLRLVEGIKHAHARALYENADLAVDQLFAGWYGGFAVEAMALGIPVACYVNHYELDSLPDGMRHELPLIDVTADSLTDVLRSWLGPRRADLRARGAESRAFVERWHDPLKTGAVLLEDYARARALRRRGKE
jgi:hypothetical protein